MMAGPVPPAASSEAHQELGRVEAGGDLDRALEPLAEARTLDVEVGAADVELALQRVLLATRRREQAAIELRQAQQRALGRRGIRRDQGGDGVERVEQQMRIELRAQRRQLGLELEPLGTLGAQLGGDGGGARLAAQLPREECDGDERAEEEAEPVVAQGCGRAHAEDALGDLARDIQTEGQREHGEREMCGAALHGGRAALPLTAHRERQRQRDGHEADRRGDHRDRQRQGEREAVAPVAQPEHRHADQQRVVDELHLGVFLAEAAEARGARGGTRAGGGGRAHGIASDSVAGHGCDRVCQVRRTGFPFSSSVTSTRRRCAPSSRMVVVVPLPAASTS